MIEAIKTSKNRPTFDFALPKLEKRSPTRGNQKDNEYSPVRPGKRYAISNPEEVEVTSFTGIGL